MSKKTWLIIGTLLVLIGGILFVSVMTILKWDFRKLSTNEYETNSYEITENFKAISLNTNIADVSLVACENSQCKVECYERKNVECSISVKDDTLVINDIDTRNWYEHIDINFGSPKITVYLPEKEYASLSINSIGDVEIPKDFVFTDVSITSGIGDVTFLSSTSGITKVRTTAGDVQVGNISAGAVDISTSTGNVSVSSVGCGGNINIDVTAGKTSIRDTKCQKLISSGGTDNILLENVIAAKNFSIERSTGDVQFEDSDAEQIFVKTSAGDITGTLLSEKIFLTETSIGEVNVPKTTSGGKCEAITSTGDIKIDIK